MNTAYSLDQLEEKAATTAAGELLANDWEQLKEISTNRMQSPDISPRDRLRWANLASQFISKKYADDPESVRREVIEQTWVRAYAVRNLIEPGPRKLSEAAALCTHVLSHIDLSREEIMEVLDSQPPASRESALRLRTVKNMLTPLMQVHELLEDEETKTEIDAWLALLPRLP
ncbi:hypothetical protein M4914_10795 [Streptomyces somaliensis DSM 40738]|uniref:Uncharacterized protein n=1 Tax=Streptomyces somaliensis (strain ATCC 33201 / DSM 40738 / JCM 12659 / KCTC 9044 / NCTC 11332 / NRRL B-12077 / IP 733) TaxID=1134445 RepID=A0AA44D9P1_STRE0|nr:hypothetical protein [Streptomyces somaliensis]MCQ0023389.1 hypothetical protein [Streptomyces somaliensis DSM 40738]NKY12782.1 hypothetical protein [Streptomyces somaliensis DSM 40738]